ncbi:XIAP-associated factor 1 [Merluccius polli]|uniref:XIAP-associated factor 1 n=1 Tax=Merluccius polli TaxID=89951 RepID=A0AA47M933_MERPO|nr:XIAP-associated factor 1 [Merluccius polli]
MDDKGHSRTCGQCHKVVAIDNFALHESHCRRFLCLCPDCDETVPREQLEQHRLDEHTQVQDCVVRLLCCEFCELELPCRELEEHECVCGSRTERCNICHNYILLRDQAQHAHTCSAANGVPPLPLRPPRLPQTTAITPDKSKG